MSSPQQTAQYSHWPRRLPRNLQIPETTLWFNLETAAARYPDKCAANFCAEVTSYAQLRDQALSLAGWLQREGLQRGERVAIYLQNCPQWMAAFYAINRADGVAVPVNPMNRADEFGHYITDANTRFVICSADQAHIVTAANEALPPERRARLIVTHYADALPEGRVPPELGMQPALVQWLESRAALPEGAASLKEIFALGLRPGPQQNGPDDLALLPYTSGTTGLPKGCIHTNRTLMSNCVGGGAWGGASAESVSLSVVPMFHITGLVYGVLGPCFLGVSVVILPRWDRELAGRLISRYRVTHWTCIPTMIVDLFASPNYGSFDLSSLLYLSGGGAAMPQAVAQRLLDEFGLTFCEGYGLTETAAPSHGNPPERAKLQCLGIPIFGVDSRIVDPVTLEEMPIGETGEIITHGPMVFKGYWNQPEATAAAFIELDGKQFFRTGDLGRLDEEGYFFITDRLKRMINASGYKVWPSEVELLLYKNPAVQEACIIAAKDSYRGETVKAVIVLRATAAGITAEDIIRWCREHMAAYKVPTQVQFVESLPKSGAGKVMWRLLQEQQDRG